MSKQIAICSPKPSNIGPTEYLDRGFTFFGRLVLVRILALLLNATQDEGQICSRIDVCSSWCYGMLLKSADQKTNNRSKSQVKGTLSLIVSHCFSNAHAARLGLKTVGAHFPTFKDETQLTHVSIRGASLLKKS